MRKPPQQSVTSLPASPEEERRVRVIKYTIAMSVRLLCVILCFFVQGWWLVAAVIGALVLPYVAVVIANTKTRDASATVLRPGSVVRLLPPGSCRRLR